MLVIETLTEDGINLSPGICKIEYKPDAPAGDVLCFKHYNPQEVRNVSLVVYALIPVFNSCWHTEQSWSGHARLQQRMTELCLQNTSDCF